MSEWADRSTWVSQACVGTSSSVHVHWTGDPWEGVEGVHQTALCLGTAPYRGTPQAPDFLCFISFPTLLRAQEYIVWAAAALAVAAYLLYRGSDRRPQSPIPPALPFGHCFNTWTSESPVLVAVSATDKKPKLCVSV